MYQLNWNCNVMETNFSFHFEECQFYPFVIPGLKSPVRLYPGLLRALEMSLYIPVFPR